MASPIKDTAWLEWIGNLVGAASRPRAVTLPPSQFHCLLDDLPLHLIPGRMFDGVLLSESEPIFFNPSCSVLPAGELPAAFRRPPDLLEAFNLGCTMAWVNDPGPGFARPFWLGPRLESLAAGFRPNEAAPASLCQKDRRLLAAAGILVPADYLDRRRQEWSEVVETRSRSFREENYVALTNLAHPFHIAALRRYYRRAIRQGAIRLGDEQSSRRYVAHNDPVARFFHYQIASAISCFVGEPVKPSYVYLASYLEGAELKKHTDREQCEFSVTLCLDFSPEPEGPTTWPIRVDTPKGTVAVYQELGDGLLYRGTTVPHYRDPLPKGYTSTSIFFHYVPEDFRGPLD